MSGIDKKKSNSSSNSVRISKTASEVCQNSKEKEKKAIELESADDSNKLELKEMQENEPKSNDHGLTKNEDTSQEAGNNGTDGAGACNIESIPFHRDSRVPDERLRLYGRLWRAMRLFIDETRQQEKNVDLNTTRFMLTYLERHFDTTFHTLPEWHGQFMEVVMSGRGLRRNKIDRHYVYIDNTRGDAVNCFRTFASLRALRQSHFRADEFQFLDTIEKDYDRRNGMWTNADNLHKNFKRFVGNDADKYLDQLNEDD